MKDFTFPVLLSDVGGTNARFALATDAVSPVIPLPSARTADFTSFEAAARNALAGTGAQPKSCVVCAAGPVSGPCVQLTNANWTIDGREAARLLKLGHGLLLNDFEALALSIPSFQPEWLRPIGGGTPQDGAQLIHGPGTGLGTAALIQADGKWRAVASEGSHSDFAPVYADEWAVWPHIEPRLGRITPESLISGPGLRRLHRGRLASLGAARPEIGEAEIIERAIADPAGGEAQTVKLFWRLAARYAGDLALNFLATGGVYLAGGILPRIEPLLDEGEFRSMFENKAPYQELASGVKVQLLTRPDAVMEGMASIARRPGQYSIDYAARAWI